MRRYLVFGLLSLAACITLACGDSGRSDSEKALDAARQWVNSSTDLLAEEIVRVVVGEVPLAGELASELLEDEIHDRLTWQYADPVKVSGSVYEVTATASTDFQFDLPLVGEQAYAISLPFDLSVDVDEGKVVNHSPDLLGVSLERQQ